MIARIAILAAAITILFSFEASACRITQDLQYESPESFVKGYYGPIALAELVAIDPLEQGVRYRFRVIDTLQGEIASSFSIDGDEWGKRLYESGVKLPTNDDFGGHRDGTSGKLVGGRSLEGTDCKLHPPTFQEGGRYLVFLDALYDSWGSERIIRDDDLWLLDVRRMVGPH